MPEFLTYAEQQRQRLCPLCRELGTRTGNMSALFALYICSSGHEFPIDESFSRSEVATLREQIDQQCVVMSQRFESCASHEAITGGYDRLSRYKVRLAAFIGENEAGLVVGGAYVKAMEGDSA